MNLNNLSKILEDQPKYRYKQIHKYIYQDFIDDWQKATSLPQDLRKKLNIKIPLDIKAEFFVSEDKKTIRALLELDDGKKIESVLLRHHDRNTVCLSSQVGCPMGCLFCATGQIGFSRNLTTEEITDQVILFSRYLKNEKQKINNLVFMGMGEPFLNYDNVIRSIDIFNNKDFFNIGARHISISTIGIPQGIRDISKYDKQINLAISLHAPTDKLREQIIPMNKKYPLKDITDSISYYLDKTKRKIMIEYIMIKDFNDNPQTAQKLADILRNLPKKLYFINLIPYNPNESQLKKFQPSEVSAIKLFKNTLLRNSINTTERHRFGREIDAACGQLAGKRK